MPSSLRYQNSSDMPNERHGYALIPNDTLQLQLHPRFGAILLPKCQSFDESDMHSWDPIDGSGVGLTSRRLPILLHLSIVSSSSNFITILPSTRHQPGNCSNYPWANDPLVTPPEGLLLQ